MSSCILQPIPPLQRPTFVSVSLKCLAVCSRSICPGQTQNSIGAAIINKVNEVFIYSLPFSCKIIFFLPQIELPAPALPRP